MTDRNTFAMSWVERDGPSVSPPERQGFGIVVIEAMNEAQPRRRGRSPLRSLRRDLAFFVYMSVLQHIAVIVHV
jgi:hypothetical protein